MKLGQALLFVSILSRNVTDLCTICVQKKQERCAILIPSKTEYSQGRADGHGFLIVRRKGYDCSYDWRGNPYAYFMPLLWPDAPQRGRLSKEAQTQVVSKGKRTEREIQKFSSMATHIPTSSEGVKKF